VVLRNQLRRREVLTFFASLPPCLIGIEACSASHHWARELTALGHQVRMMPARYVKPYVQRGKSDALDAAAICEAVSRPTMRFAAIKSVEQQSALTLHRAREILVKQETMLANLIRGCLGEFGIVAPLGIRRMAELVGEHEQHVRTGTHYANTNPTTQVGPGRLGRGDAGETRLELARRCRHVRPARCTVAIALGPSHPLTGGPGHR